MTSSPVDEIKNRLDIVEVIGSYIKLQKAGINFRAICPFHAEKNPSFFVSPSRQIWHCFGGCSIGGDIFKFVMRIEGVEFGDALRMLAQRAGVQLKKERPELRTQRQRLYEICELAARFFEKQLDESQAGLSAKKYLLKRGITKDAIKKWRIGYSPDVMQGLSDFLVGQGYNRQEIVKAGLSASAGEQDFSQNNRNDFQLYDRFRSRIIFPILDLNSQVIGFGGRIFGRKEKGEVAKYVNTPNTLLYDKSRVLYGLNSAKTEIRKRKECILVEGYTDVILASQAGFENVVATSGTALTPSQLRMLKRYSENLLTAFDMDLAGDTATKRGIDLAQAMGFNIKVLLLSEGSDPAETIAKNPQLWSKLVKEAHSILDFYFETTFSKIDHKTPEGKKEVSKILLPVIRIIPNSIERSFWLQKLAKKLEVKEEDVVEELKKIKPTQTAYDLEQQSKPATVEAEKKSRREMLEERIVSLIIKLPDNFNFFPESDFEFSLKSLAELVSEFKKKGVVAPKQPQLAELFNYLSLKAEVEDEEIDGKEEFKNCLKEIRYLDIRDKLGKISQGIKKAEEEKQIAEVEKLIKEFNNYSKMLGDLENVA